MKVIEYDDCIYGLQEDVIKYLLAEVNNIMTRVGMLTDDELDHVKEIIDVVRDLHDNCSGMVKIYYNDMGCFTAIDLD